ncbi:threonylcarbamoyl-AMP synthase [archaeon]|nr:MAG: threonylcarbamoyl-AMP synthase [archaeon]
MNYLCIQFKLMAIDLLVMKVLKAEVDAIEKAAQVLEIGGIVVYPTETLYGLGANALDENAVRLVFEIKGRDKSKPSSVAFRNLEQARKFLAVTPLAEKLAKKFLPGPLTIILNSKFEFQEFLGGSKVSMRIPDHPVAQALLKRVKFPITATSANLSGGKNPVEAIDAIEQIGGSVDLVLDAGKCKLGKPSTVVDVSEGELKIIREGAIPKEKLASMTL